MTGSFGKKSRDIIGNCVFINGKQVLDSNANLDCNNLIVRKDASMKNASINTLDVTNTANISDINTDTVTINNELLVNGPTIFNNTVDLSNGSLIANGLDSSYTSVKVFTGTTVNVGDQIEHVLFHQQNHSRSVVEIIVFIHDVNSDTYWRYSEGKYMWYREWTNTAQEITLGSPVNVGTGDPLHYVIERFQNDNDISIRITQNTPIDTNTKYKIIAKIIQNNF